MGQRVAVLRLQLGGDLVLFLYHDGPIINGIGASLSYEFGEKQDTVL